MRPDLLGMNNEELIQWVCRFASIGEDEVRNILPDIEVYCASHPIGLYDFMERFARLRKHGVISEHAISALKKVDWE